jgi:hypothetical protein
MKILIQHIAAFLLILHSASVVAQDTTHLSLQTIFQKIETSYPEILMYDSKIKSIQAQAEGAKSWMPPTASFGLDRFPYDFTMLNSKDDPMNQAGLMFSGANDSEWRKAECKKELHQFACKYSAE